MILHLLIVDDEEDVLESMIPGLVNDLAKKIRIDDRFAKANEAAGCPVPKSGRLNIKVSTVNYQSSKIEKYAYHRPAHLHLHLCCEKGGSFRHALRLLKEQFFAVVVSDLRFSDDMLGSRAGRLFIEDVHRRNPETLGILYSAYQRPEGFPEERFVRKGSAANLGGDELIDKLVRGITDYISAPKIQRFAQEIAKRGLIYQSDEFGASLRRLYDYALLYFGTEPPVDAGRRAPRPTLLIDGETGAGKTEFASLLHQLSERRTEPYLSATCNQLTDETFLRSTLFGHVKGSFTGASADRPGLVHSAGKGVLLLDDLHKLTDGGSVILHSFLDDGVFSHLGQDEVRRTSQAAIVCTVETPKWEEIKTDGRLPESFVNRVEQLVLRIPPLRSRPADIEIQSQHYCAAFSKQIGAEMELSDGVIAWLMENGLPGGNSRRLRDFLKGLVTANARVTDFIDVPELDDYAAEIGLLGRGTSKSMPTKPTTAPLPAPAAKSAPWPPVKSGWQDRIVRLAAKAIAKEYGIDPEAAAGLCEKLFCDRFPELWKIYRQLVETQPPAMEIKLFDELFRYYAIFLTGNPAKAAKELGMKDNALREFVYSREQRHEMQE